MIPNILSNFCALQAYAVSKGDENKGKKVKCSVSITNQNQGTACPLPVFPVHSYALVLDKLVQNIEVSD